MCKVRVDLGEKQDGCGRMWGWFWAKVGLVTCVYLLTSHMQSYKGSLYYWVESWFPCGNNLGKRWGQFKEKAGLVLDGKWE